MADNAPDDDHDDGVGYCRPPKHKQWKKGQSGNPHGRPKGSRGLKTDLTTILAKQQTVSVRGESYSGTKQYLYLFMLATRAAAGDLKAAALLGPLILQLLGSEDRGTSKQQLSAHDQALLDELLAEDDGDEPEAKTDAADPGGTPVDLADDDNEGPQDG